MTKDGLQRMLEFLDRLRSKEIEFRIEQQSPDELLVHFALIGARVEVTFDVHRMHYSVFKGAEAVSTDVKGLDELLARHV